MDNKNNTFNNVTTKEGYARFAQELDLLKTVKRAETAEKIKTAKEFGDLSENSEYDAALEEQGFIENRILELEYFLKNVQIIEAKNDNIVNVGKTVSLIKEDDGQVFIVKIVGNNEASPFSMEISALSAVGSAIMEKQQGETVEVDTPIGKITYIIDKVEI